MKLIRLELISKRLQEVDSRSRFMSSARSFPKCVSIF